MYFFIFLPLFSLSLHFSNSIGISPSHTAAAYAATPSVYTSNNKARRSAAYTKHDTAAHSAAPTPATIWSGTQLRKQRFIDAAHTNNNLCKKYNNQPDHEGEEEDVDVDVEENKDKRPVGRGE